MSSNPFSDNPYEAPGEVVQAELATRRLPLWFWIGELAVGFLILLSLIAILGGHPIGSKVVVVFATILIQSALVAYFLGWRMK